MSSQDLREGRQSARRWLGLVGAVVLGGCVGSASHSLNQPEEAGGGPRAVPPELKPTAFACTIGGDPGTVTLHRLNRVEYNLTVRDLLGDTTGPASAFPVDDTGAGFDNNADVLSMSPLLYEKYDAAAEKLVADAWAKDTTPGPTARIRICNPAAGMEAACARQILEKFAHLAWRRPIASSELDRLVSFLTVAAQQGEGFAQGTMLAMQAILLSPHFLFRVELDPDPASAEPHLLTGPELATRLSYFLWSSTPDLPLLTAAEAGELKDLNKLADHARRMLKDPRATAFVDNFAGQWLAQRRLAVVKPDLTVFPSFTEPLREAMQQETRLFFQEFLKNPLNMRDMLDAPFTFANDTLAQHYQLPSVGSTTPKKISLSPGARGGLLTQAGILTATSLTTRTSAVRRAKYVLGSLLCSPTPDPPADIPPLSASTTVGSQRQKVEQATSGGVCVGCHRMLNPIGFSMEGYDGIGTTRTKDGDYELDTSGKLPDGRAFADVRQLSALLKADPRLTQCISKNILTYALGREMSASESCALEALGTKIDAGGGHLEDLLVLIVQSPQFSQRRGEP